MRTQFFPAKRVRVRGKTRSGFLIDNWSSLPLASGFAMQKVTFMLEKFDITKMVVPRREVENRRERSRYPVPNEKQTYRERRPTEGRA